MEEIIYHIHHIKPRHQGGTDDPSNLIKVNIPLHALLHKLLWEEYHNEYDHIAWRCLSGQITNAEANILATKISNTGKTPWNKGKKGTDGYTNHVSVQLKGKPRTDDVKAKISKKTKLGMMASPNKAGRKKGSVPWNKGINTPPRSMETKAKISAGVLAAKKHINTP